MNRHTAAGAKPRILIVDDDDVLRRWLRTQLEPRGFKVWEESQGDEALSAYRRGGPWDFVLSDLSFYPGEQIRNGLHLIHQILRINPHQRVAIHTSETKVSAPPCVVLQKPYAISALLKLLRTRVSSTKVDE